ncbi:hypothetical protein [Streptomyces sp. A0592]|uniref:hypothetical protein n=1 Tax=Streptomyces sp. A0592 TaxID=2563099 RepID=UPI00109ED39C|nr:hypothetical protein [Streptomyces sp. A0592]THA80602.1 hypothetical protein E6U81_27685 [Streptomyces sp. A0592]
MKAWSTATENELRRLINAWDPIGVADDVRGEYDCMLAPLLGRLRSGADRTEIADFLQHELQDHYGLESPCPQADATAARLVAWWASTGPARGAARTDTP